MRAAAILDSSVFLNNYLNEDLVDLSSAILAGLSDAGVTLHAPALLLYEVNSALRNAAQRNRVTQESALISLEHFLRMPIQYHFESALVRRGFEIASESSLPTTYDCQYLALAERLECDLWTADRKFCVAVSDDHPEVRWLGEWKTTTLSGSQT